MGSFREFFADPPADAFAMGCFAPFEAGFARSSG
jgi:hypothetical protein